MVNFNIKEKSNKSKSLLYKTFEINNDGKKISWKTIKAGYDSLLKNGYSKNNIYVKVMTPVGLRTIKGFDSELDDTLDDYFKNKVKDPSKFSKDFTEVIYGIYE